MLMQGATGTHKKQRMTLELSPLRRTLDESVYLVEPLGNDVKAHRAQNRTPSFLLLPSDPPKSLRRHSLHHSHCERGEPPDEHFFALMEPTLGYQLSHHGYICLTLQQQGCLPNSSASTESLDVCNSTRF